MIKLIGSNLTQTEKEAQKVILPMIEKDFGKTLEQLKIELKEKAVKSQTDWKIETHLRSSNGYSLFYNVNPNFKQGLKNGGGVGLFATLQGVGMVQTVRLESPENYV